MTTEHGPRRDRWIALGAALVVVALSVSILSTVLDAQRRGRHALEQLQVNQLGQLTRSLDARVTAGYAAIGGLARVPYTLAPRDPGDANRLQQLQALNPDAKTGMMLVDTSATIAKPYGNPSLLARQLGFHRVGHQVAALATVPSVGWKAIFTQDAAEFDGGLGRRIDTAIVLLIVGGLVAAAAGFFALLRRL